MMENSERIIEKIKKVLELSKNNPSKEEAQAAALKAQKLMAEYNISFKEIDGIENVDSITEKSVEVGIGNKWKYVLSQIVAKNFGCKVFSCGKETIVFYGYNVNAETAAETFSFLFQTGNKLANSHYNKLRNNMSKKGLFFNGKGVKNSFLIGYSEGIKEGLEKQCTALMITIPKKVEESYSEKSKVFTKHNISLKTGGWHGVEAREEGRKAGKNAVNSREIAASM